MTPLAAGHVDTTVLAAFAVGFISFISPCVLPLVPGYLSAISGISFAEIRAGSRKAHVLLPAALFCLSFTVMFVLLGMGATGVGLGLAVPFILCALAFARVTGIFRFLRDHYTAITLVSGAILVAMGVLLYTDQLARLNTWLNDAGLNSIGNL